MKEVRIVAEGAGVKLPSGALQMHPVGWSGAVDAAIADAWVAMGVAVAIEPETPPQLTPHQTAVLAAAADEIIAQVAAATAPVEAAATAAAADKPAKRSHAKGRR